MNNPLPAPPQGTKIQVVSQDGRQVIIVPCDKESIWRFIVGGFLLLHVLVLLLTSPSRYNDLILESSHAFLIFWVGGRLIGVIVQCYLIYRLLRKRISETLTLNSSLSFDSGVPPLRLKYSEGFMESAQTLFFIRDRIKFEPSELESLTLRETDSGGELTINKGQARIQLVSGVSNEEKEWVFNILQQHFSAGKYLRL